MHTYVYTYVRCIIVVTRNLEGMTLEQVKGHTWNYCAEGGKEGGGWEGGKEGRREGGRREEAGKEGRRKEGGGWEGGKEGGGWERG